MDQATPYKMNVILEGSSYALTMHFIDHTGQPFTPSVVSIRVIDPVTLSVVFPQDVIPTGPVYTLVINGGYNTMINPALAGETRQVLVNAGNATNIQAVAEHLYYIRKIPFNHVMDEGAGGSNG